MIDIWRWMIQYQKHPGQNAAFHLGGSSQKLHKWVENWEERMNTKHKVLMNKSLLCTSRVYTTEDLGKCWVESSCLEVRKLRDISTTPVYHQPRATLKGIVP
jgi:hypothetical protein